MFIGNSKPGSERKVLTGLLEWLPCAIGLVYFFTDRLFWFVNVFPPFFSSSSPFDWVNRTGFFKTVKRKGLVLIANGFVISNIDYLWLNDLINSWILHLTLTPILNPTLPANDSSKTLNSFLWPCFLDFVSLNWCLFSLISGYFWIWRPSLHDFVQRWTEVPRDVRAQPWKWPGNCLFCNFFFH